MRMKRNEAINHFGISSRSLHYWENAGLLQSSCDETIPGFTMRKT